MLLKWGIDRGTSIVPKSVSLARLEVRSLSVCVLSHCCCHTAAIAAPSDVICTPSSSKLLTLMTNVQENLRAVTVALDADDRAVLDSLNLNLRFNDPLFWAGMEIFA